MFHHHPEDVRTVYNIWAAEGKPRDIGAGYFHRVLEGIDSHELTDLLLHDEYCRHVEYHIKG